MKKNQNHSDGSRLARVLILTTALFCGLVIAGPASADPPTFVDINPDGSGPLVAIPDPDKSCPFPCPSGGSGGRVNGLAAVPENPKTYFAASELGGLFKTTNGGNSWFHLDGYIPTRTWDVATTSAGLKVYATSFYDGRVDSLAGIEVSADGGSTWSHPNIVPPVTCAAARKSQPSAYGISIRPDAPNEVLVGTNCGIQRSTNAGGSWTAGSGVDNVVWDVVALAGGKTYYACGEAGFLSSSDGKAWITASQPAPGKMYCRLAVSPDESHVVFAVFARVVYAGASDFIDYMVARDSAFLESDDGGKTWSPIPCLPGPKGGDPKNSADCPYAKRNPFVATNKRSKGFDLWLGGGHLHQVPCNSPSPFVPGGSVRCTTDIAKWSDTFTDANVDYTKAHGDSGDLVFDPAKSVDACPTLYSSDGGIYRNSKTASPECHDQASFQPANVGVHALLLLGMAGSHRAGSQFEDIYLALQDNGLFYTGNAGAAKPSWTQGQGGDVIDVVADGARAVAQAGWSLNTYDAGLSNRKAVYSGPWIECVGHGVRDAITRYGPGQYVIAIRSKNCGTSIGVQLTTDIDSNPLGSPLGTWPASARPPCQLRVSKRTTETEVYALAGECNWNGDWGSPDQLWRYAAGNWTQVQPPSPGTGFSIFAVDPANPDRLYASVIGTIQGKTKPLGMYRSTDGGATWKVDQALTDNIHGVIAGKPRFVSVIEDAQDGAHAGPVAQPTLVAFDPEDSNIIVAGGRESGVFISRDGGGTWTILTDPFTPGTSGVPHLPRPFFAHFDHRSANSLPSIYIGTLGRGVWRIDLAPPGAGDIAVDHHYDLTTSYWRLLYGLVDDSPGALINIQTGQVKPVPPRFRDLLKYMLLYEVAATIKDESGLAARKSALNSMKLLVEKELRDLER
jgi:hypothetical protein